MAGLDGLYASKHLRLFVLACGHEVSFRVAPLPGDVVWCCRCGRGSVFERPVAPVLAV